MSEAQIPESLPSLLIPMNGRPWLIPNIVVAEVIPLRQPDRPGHGPEWLLGWINWREQDLPLISYEKLNESGQVAIGPDARIRCRQALQSRKMADCVARGHLLVEAALLRKEADTAQ